MTRCSVWPSRTERTHRPVPPHQRANEPERFAAQGKIIRKYKKCILCFNSSTKRKRANARPTVARCTLSTRQRRKRRNAATPTMTISNGSKWRERYFFCNIQTNLNKLLKQENNPPTSQLPTNTIQHRLSGGGIADNLLKDPSENERMERVKK